MNESIFQSRVLKSEPATVQDKKVKRERVEKLISPEPAEKRAITSLWPAVLRVSGAPSGTTYRWPASGAQVLVANEDVEFVMAKNHTGKHACCGSGGRRIYFKLD